MEGTGSHSSALMMQPISLSRPPKPVRLRQICPVEAIEKELAESSCSSANYCSTLDVKQVYLPGTGKTALQQVFHLCPRYRFATFLKEVQLLGHEHSPFLIHKNRSFPSNQYSLIDSLGNCFELTSNFTGSTYSLTKDCVTHMTMIFEAGCGSSYRNFSIFVLREAQAWQGLQGTALNHQLDKLYEKGRNFERIGKFTSLQPTICPQRHVYTMQFSRKFVIPCVENTIVVDHSGLRVLELVKVDEDSGLFELSVGGECSPLVGVAAAVALLDFKLSVQ